MADGHFHLHQRSNVPSLPQINHQMRRNPGSSRYSQGIRVWDIYPELSRMMSCRTEMWDL